LIIVADVDAVMYTIVQQIRILCDCDVI